MNQQLTGFDCTVEGTYYAFSPNPGQSGSLQKPYTQKCVVPNPETAQYILRRVVLPRLLSARFTDFKGIRTSHIVSLVARNPYDTTPIPFEFMSREQLANYVAVNGEMTEEQIKKNGTLRSLVDVEEYRDVPVHILRSDIKMAERKPEVFKVRRERRMLEIKAIREAMELNPDLVLMDAPSISGFAKPDNLPSTVPASAEDRRVIAEAEAAAANSGSGSDIRVNAGTVTVDDEILN